MDSRLDRRDFVGYAGVGAGALILGGVAVDPSLALRRQRRNRVPLARDGSFAHGIASGEPAPQAITLWTRLGGFQRDRRLFVEVAKDPDFRRVVLRRKVRATANRDHTVETRVSGRALKPDTQYFYRFETRNRSSAVGRFRTARPPDSREPTRIGFFSCQDYQAGYYGAHSLIAAEDLDAVICLGDYIYERNFYEGPRKDTLGPNGDGEVQTLAEYRQKYQLYRADTDLQAMHAVHPFMATWDDHEVEDNYAGGQPGEATGQVRVPFAERQRNAYRAYYEYMPFAPVHNRPRRGRGLYRQLRLGHNLEMFILDQRQFRGDQPCDDAFFTPCPEAEEETRPFLGSDQLEWLKAGLQRSSATWKVIGSAVMAMSLDTAGKQPINKDQWDGYGAERRELFGFVEARGIQNLALITGDIHTFFAGEVGVDGRGPGSVATEFVGGSITSHGIPETVQGISGVPLSNEQYTLITENIRTVNPHLKYDEQLSRGFGVLEARPDELLVEFNAVDSQQRDPDSRTIGRFRVASGTPRVQVLQA